MLEQANKDILQLKEDYQKEKQRKEELERELDSLRESERLKASEITGFMSSLSDKDATIEQKDKIIKELETKIQNFPDVSKLKEENELYIEKLQKATAELDEKEKALKEANQLASSRGEKIGNLQEELRKANGEIEDLKRQILALKEDIEKLRQNIKKVTGSTAPPEPPVIPDGDDGPDGPTAPPVSPVIPDGDDGPDGPTASPVPPGGDDDGYVDFPTIDKKTGKVKRSILRVVDIEHEPPITIDSDEFFNGDPESIERVTRMLAEASATGREAYLCECCRNPVKIAKRDFGSHEVLFFSHCRRDIECEWKQEQSVAKTPPPVGGNPPIDDRSKRRAVKELIVRSLQSDVSKAKGVEDVEESKIIRSKYKFMRYRRAGIFARYRERNLVFELLTKDVLMNNVVNKDIFCRLHDHHVIWIFGADENTKYDYVIKHVNMNTMYANRRNVFIIDKEAIDACEERQELVLKCNYLDPDNKWHYRNETTGNNGMLITLDDLQFDDEMCKPYFFDANKEYFMINPDKEAEYNDSIIDREKLLKDMQDTYEGRLAEIRKKKNGTKTQPEKELEPEPGLDSDTEISDTEFAGRYFYYHNGKYGIVDENDNFIIPCKYDDIECWTLGKYLVKVIDQWGVIDESQNIVVDIKYLSIQDLNNGKALAKTSTESYYIDENGNRLPDEIIKLHNGWTKFRFGTKWGILGENKNVIVEPVYDEIGSFRCRLIGVRNGSFQKLVPRYEYRLKMHCKCTDNVGNRAVYDMNGLLLKETSLKLQTIGKVFNNKVISNITFKTNTIYINDVSPKKENEKFPHVDNDYDFTMGEILTGVIMKKVVKKIFVQFRDGRLSYFNKTLLERAGKQLSDYGMGKEITLQKVGFDSDFERTEWKLVFCNI